MFFLLPFTGCIGPLAGRGVGGIVLVSLARLASVVRNNALLKRAGFIIRVVGLAAFEIGSMRQRSFRSEQSLE